MRLKTLAVVWLALATMSQAQTSARAKTLAQPAFNWQLPQRVRQHACQ